MEKKNFGDIIRGIRDLEAGQSERTAKEAGCASKGLPKLPEEMMLPPWQCYLALHQGDFELVEQLINNSPTEPEKQLLVGMRTAWFLEDQDAVQELLVNAEKCLDKTSDKVWVYFLLAELFIVRGEIDNIEIYLYRPRRHLRHFEKRSHRLLLGLLELNEIHVNITRGITKESHHKLTNLIAAYKDNSFIVGYCHLIFGLLGRLHGQIDDATRVSHLKKAIEIFRQFPDFYLLGLAQQEMAYCDIPLNEAQECCRQAVALFTKLNRVREAEATKSLIEEIQVKAPALRKPSVKPLNIDGYVVFSDKLRAIINKSQMALADPTKAPILILGETGTGKTELAEIIHNMSRRNGPFITVECPQLRGDLVASKLFGHVKGAFTDAHKDNDGFFRSAHGGTIFLDEIGDLPIDAQAQLLRVVEKKVVTPVGSQRDIQVDVLIIAATNLDLVQLKDEGEFRFDFLKRFGTWKLRIPPLRQRRDDILPIAESLIKTLSPKDLVLDDSARNYLLTHPLPGNVRDLYNCIRRGVTEAEFNGCRIITAAMIHDDENQTIISSISNNYLQQMWQDRIPTFTQAMQEFEYQYLLEVLKRSNGRIAKATDLAGLSRSALYRMVKRHQLSPTFVQEYV